MFGLGKSKDRQRTLPTVRFDPSRVTDAVKNDLWDRVQEFEDMPYGQEQAIYDAALASIVKGGALPILAGALTAMGVQRERATEISRYLWFRASAIMNVERMVALGLKEAKWRHSGAPCYTRVTPTQAQLHMDAAHKMADGKCYPILKGMLIDGRRTHPGMDPGCRCLSMAIVPGFDD